MSFALLGIGTASPEHSIAQRDAAEFGLSLSAHTAAETRLLPALYRRAGVRTRHSVLLERSANGEAAGQSFYPPASSPEDQGPGTAARMRAYEQHAAPLARSAARGALEAAGVAAGDVTHLITVSCSGFSAPGVDISLIRELGLNASVARTHVGFMGCHAALNALRVAAAFTAADPRACVLLTAVELCTLHLQYGWNPDRIVSNALFADGAAAAVGRRATAETGDGWQLAASGSMVIPGTADDMGWQIGDHGFEMSLSPRVPDVIREHLRPWMEGWLDGHGLTIDQVGSWAVHPGGPRILTATAEAAGFDPALLGASRDILAEFGNMSSPTVLFILDRLLRRQAPRPCVALAFGPGLTVEAALLE